MDAWPTWFTIVLYGLLLVVIAVGGIILDFTHKYSGFRGFFTYLLHLVTLGLGLLLGKWCGLLLFSIPLLIFYYYFMAHLAMVVVPAAEPDNHKEWIKRIRYFFMYIWGFQYPGWVVEASAGRIAETRIKGDPFIKYTSPGLVWAYTHQVVGLTAGITFSRIVAPGTVFTNAYERPFYSIIDLRTQLRTCWIDVVSSDGIPYKALLFTAFTVDRDRWNLDTLRRLYQEDRLLKEARGPDYQEGSFPFSRLRIRTLIGNTGVRRSKKDPKELQITYWDEMVLYQIEKTASEILSQKRFDELWLLPDDQAGICAADNISEDIRTQCFFNLLCRGVRFYSCRLVNFRFTREKLKEEPETVERQLIATWQADWQRDTIETRADGNAEAELLQQQARASAYAALLTAIAEGLQETRLFQQDLPRNLIAMRFIGALEEMLQRQPDGDSKSEATSVINTWKQNMRLGSPRG